MAIRNLFNFGGLAFCGFAAYHSTHSIVTAAAVAWGLWIVMPDPNR